MFRGHIDDKSSTVEIIAWHLKETSEMRCY